MILLIFYRGQDREYLTLNADSIGVLLIQTAQDELQEDPLRNLEEDQPELSGRFHRGRNTTNIPGSGPGRAIVKGIADLHQASVDVKSDENGTEVNVRFPVIQ